MIKMSKATFLFCVRVYVCLSETVGGMVEE